MFFLSNLGVTTLTSPKISSDKILLKLYLTKSHHKQKQNQLLFINDFYQKLGGDDAFYNTCIWNDVTNFIKSKAGYLLSIYTVMKLYMDKWDEYNKYKDNKDIVIGAGTVLDAETARMAILAGAQYVVSPSLSAETIKMCNRYRIAVMPGIMTVKEAVEALHTIFGLDSNEIAEVKGDLPNV